jgi:hypothetical protein
MPQQLDLCDPYLANKADYEVLEMAGRPQLFGRVLESSHTKGARTIDRTSDYLQAVEQARTHCLLSGKVVWVVDRNDGNWVAFKVSPDEYTARELRTRTYTTTESVA